MNFLITGVLECIERDDATNLIQNCGGKVLKTLGKKTDYLVVGREPGAAKIEKANNFKIKQITEDELYEMIEKSSGNAVGHHQSEKTSPTVSKSPKKVGLSNKLQTEKTIVKTPTKSPNKSSTTKVSDNSFKSSNEIISEVMKKSVVSPRKETLLTARPVFTNNSSSLSNKITKTHNLVPGKTPADIMTDKGNLSTRGACVSTELWVDKYKPTSLRSLIGQNGASSPANRLLAWLSSWHSNFSAGLLIFCFFLMLISIYSIGTTVSYPTRMHFFCCRIALYIAALTKR
ncbi:unnamed protein product [Trichobilharzia regenti]|nr:unnamed protein product [Trichobilharzia regenti]